MRKSIATCVLTTAALLGCDARAGEDYRGEVLLQMTGRLILEEGELAADAVPALAFWGPDTKLLIVDVDTRGEFPAGFSIDVMSPPPVAAMRAFPGMPSYAIGHITALPPDHPAEFTVPGSVDGAGAFTWCENRDNTDCYRRIEQCIAGTTECYRELARCVNVPIEGQGEGAAKLVCDEILEQSGDPSIANVWEKFAGLSVDYSVLYVDRSAPADEVRKYVERSVQDGSLGAPALVFRDEPITAGYHLIRTTEMSSEEREATQACADRIEATHIDEYNQAHGTSWRSPDEIYFDHIEQGRDPEQDGELVALQTKVVLATYDAGCLVGGVKHERIDPGSTSITVTLGTRDLMPWSL